MALENNTPAESSLVTREPDAILEIVAWVDDAPKPTMMTSRGHGDRLPEAKYQRVAEVRNPANGKVAKVPVVGTLRQFQFASAAFVEGYKSSDGKSLYVQPHLDRAAVSADALL